MRTLILALLILAAADTQPIIVIQSDTPTACITLPDGFVFCS